MGKSSSFEQIITELWCLSLLPSDFVAIHVGFPYESVGCRIIIFDRLKSSITPVKLGICFFIQFYCVSFFIQCEVQICINFYVLFTTITEYYFPVTCEKIVIKFCVFIQRRSFCPCDFISISICFPCKGFTIFRNRFD